VRRPSIRCLAAVGALAVVVAVPTGGCAAQPVSPLPVEAPTTTPSGSAPVAGSSGSPAASRSVGPVKTSTPKPTEDENCRGPIRYSLDVQSPELALVRSMCFRVGGVLRLQNIGPGLVDARPERLVSQTYEAGVVDVRFVRPGTVTVTVPESGRKYKITVVVIR
jgi:hypothetical protein